MNKEEYEIIFIPNEGRAIKNNITGKIYYSEFQIIEEKDNEIERLNNIITELEKELEYEKNMYKENLDIETTDTVKEFLRGNAWLADDMLNRLKELKENKDE